MKNYNVLALFDGMSCGQYAIRNIFAYNITYYAVEIEKGPMKVTKFNFPNTIQLGDIRDLDVSKLPRIDMVFAGFPCQGFSIAGKRKGMSTITNVEVVSLEQYMKLKKSGFEFHGQSYLFWETMRILKEVNPTYFILENVTMSKKWENIINDAIGVKPIMINSLSVSYQFRKRLYWTNIPNVIPPEKMELDINDFIPGGRSCGSRGVLDKVLGKYVSNFTIRKGNMYNCVVTKGTTNQVILSTGKVRNLTIEELEELQTLPVGYTNVPGVTKTERRKMLGNGWTVKVIEHILSFVPEYQKEKLNKFYSQLNN